MSRRGAALQRAKRIAKYPALADQYSARLVREAERVSGRQFYRTKPSGLDALREALTLEQFLDQSEGRSKS